MPKDAQGASVVQGEARLDFGRLDALLGFHLRMASGAVARDFAATMDELGLTQKQCAVLELIAANPHISQIDMAAALGPRLDLGEQFRALVPLPNAADSHFDTLSERRMDNGLFLAPRTHSQRLGHHFVGVLNRHNHCSGYSTSKKSISREQR
jgi:hypothetical protein